MTVAGWLLVAACSGDPSRVEGALSRAASAVSAHDAEALFEVLDQRARFALGSVYRSRTRAAEIIRDSYPPEARATALAELGDAPRARSAADLFRMRCGDPCLAAFAAVLGAPKQVDADGALATVQTVRGTEVQLYRGDDGRYGVVWETDALVRERTRAAAELDLIEKNAARYRSQQALRSGDAPR